MKPSSGVLVLSLLGLLATSLAGAEPPSKTLRSLPTGCVPAPGTATNAATGLPQRVVHPPSGVALVLIQAGEFLMGSPNTETGRLTSEDQHRRVIRQPFYLGETEVTVAQFRRFVKVARYETDAEAGTPLDIHRKGSFAAVPAGDRDWSTNASWQNPFPNLPEYQPHDDHPVIHVSWNDAQRFCQHFDFRLPTEAQWEFAARAGSRTSYFWGDNAEDGAAFANVADRQGRRRFKNWNQSFLFDDGAVLITKAGSYRPNAWGLYDMVGNVVEWVEDGYVRRYPGDGADESAAPADAKLGRVLRGGSWLDATVHTRSAVRVTMHPAARRDFIGFRVVKRIGL